jgi:competence protein ComEC
MNRPRILSLITRRAAIGLAIAAVLAMALPGRPAVSAPKAPEVSVEVLDVGQGDAILIRSPEGKTALIDAGPGRNVVALLKQRKVTSIDLLVLTHHHADHYGGMTEVIKEFKPRVFLASGSSHTTASYLKLLQLVRDEGIRAISPTPNARRIGLGTAVLTILPQPPENNDEENDNSIGIRLDFGNFSALITGDSQDQSRAYWLRTCPALVKDVTLLKLAHHGSRNGTDARWLDSTRPEIAAASLGAGNEYGHPHPEVLSLLDRRNVPLLRTDLAGTLKFVSDGATWDVATSRKGRAEVAARAPSRPPAGDRDEGVVTASMRVNINTATQEELETLPGVGPTTARRIIAGRPYRTADELLGVRGIGETKLAGLRPMITVR